MLTPREADELSAALKLHRSARARVIFISHKLAEVMQSATASP